MDLAELTLELCSAAGPAGFEESVSRLIAEKIAPFVEEVKTDVKELGNSAKNATSDVDRLTAEMKELKLQAGSISAAYKKITNTQ